MNRLLTALVLAPALFAQQIENFEIRKAQGTTRGTLIATVSGREVNVSNDARQAWKGWTPAVLLYSEPFGEGERLQLYDALTGASRTLANESAPITAVSHVRLPGGDDVLVISTRDAGGVPSLSLADAKGGVFRREQFAAAGPIVNDTVQIRRYRPRDLERVAGDLSLIQPVSVSTVPLTRTTANPVGTYEANLPAAGAAGRKVTLEVAPNGVARLSIEYVGEGRFVERGRWSQNGSELTLALGRRGRPEAPAPLVWTVTESGLTPKSWDRSAYGSAGLLLTKTSSDPPVLRRPLPPGR